MIRALRLLCMASLVAACQAGTAAEPTANSPTVTATPSATVLPVATARLTPSPSPSPSVVPTPSPSPTPTPTLPPPTAFALNLYEEGDFVPQHTFEWCVGASIQMAHNLVRPERRNTFEDQQALWEMARDRSTNAFNGANPRGWAATLDEIGIGPYELVSIPDYGEALRTAAAAMRGS